MMSRERKAYNLVGGDPEHDKSHNGLMIMILALKQWY